MTTGAFRDAYRAAMLGDVTAHAGQHHTVQTCTGQKVGLLSLSADVRRAEVLVLALLTTTDTTSATPRVTPLTVTVRLLDTDGTRLIAGMADPSRNPLAAEVPAGIADLAAAVTAGRAAITARFGSGFGSVTLLAAVDHYRLDTAGTRTSLGELRLEIGMLNVRGSWLADTVITVASS